MDLTLNYVSDTSGIKSQNTEGYINLELGYNDKPLDLHMIDDHIITVKIGNVEGYVKDITVDTSKLDDDKQYQGRFNIPLSDSEIVSLPPGIYYLEVWINVKDQNGNQQKMIFPSKGVVPMTLKPNMVNGSNSLPMITYDNIRKDWNDFKNFVLENQAHIAKNLATMDDTTNKFVQKVDSGVSGYAEFIDSADSNLTSMASSGEDYLNSAVSATDSHVAGIDSEARSAKTTVEHAADNVYSTVASNVNSAKADIHDKVVSADNDTTTTASNATSSIHETASSADNYTTATASKATSIIDSGATTVVSKVTSTMDSADYRIDHAADGINEDVNSIVNSGTNVMNNNISNMNSVTSSAVNTVETEINRINGQTSSAVSNINYTVNSADNYMDRDVASAERNVSSTTSSADTYVSSLTDVVSDKTSSADTFIGSDVSSGESDIHNTVISADNDINGTAKSNTDLIGNTASQADVHIDSDVNSAEGRISGNVTSADQDITSHANSGVNYITDNTNSAVAHVDKDVANADDHFTSLSNDTDTKLASASENISNHAAAIGSMTTSYSNGLNTQTSSAYDHITSDVNSIHSGIDQSAAKAYSDIQVSATNTYNNILGNANKALTSVSNSASSAYSSIGGSNSSALVMVSNSAASATTSINNIVASADQYINDFDNKVNASASSAYEGVKTSAEAAYHDINDSLTTALTSVSNSASSAYGQISGSNSSASSAISYDASVATKSIEGLLSSADGSLEYEINHAGAAIQSKVADTVTRKMTNSASDVASQAAVTALNQTNARTDGKVSDLQNQINDNKNNILASIDNLKPNLARVTSCDFHSWNNVGLLPINLVKGAKYWVSYHVNRSKTSVFLNVGINTNTDSEKLNNTKPMYNQGDTACYSFISNVSEHNALAFFEYSDGDGASISDICITQSENYVPFEVAESNKLGNDINKPNLANKTHETFGGYNDGGYNDKNNCIPVHVIKGKNYWLSVYANSNSSNDIGINLLKSENNAPLIIPPVDANNLAKGEWTATFTGVAYFFVQCNGLKNGDVSKICITQSEHFVPFEIAQANREAIKNASGKDDLQAQITSNKNSISDNSLSNTKYLGVTNLNSINCGIYRFQQGSPNAPEYASGVIKYVKDNDGIGYQIAYSDTGSVFYRFTPFGTNSWSSWDRLTHQSDINNLQNQITNIYNQTNSDLSNFQDQISNNYNRTNSDVGDLQNQISNNYNRANSDVSNLQNQITQNKNDISDNKPHKLSSGDLNNISDGKYIIAMDGTANINNLPFDNTYFYGVVYQYTAPQTNVGAITIVQRAFNANYNLSQGYGAEFLRVCQNGNWSGWNKIASNKDFDDLQDQVNQNKTNISDNYNDLMNKINSRPAWDDDKAKSLATDTLNQANANMEVNRVNLHNEISNTDALPIKGEIPTTKLSDINDDGIYTINNENIVDGHGDLRASNNYYGWLKVFHAGVKWQILYTSWGNVNDRNNTGVDGTGTIAYRSSSQGDYSKWTVVSSEDQIDDLQNQITQNKNNILNTVFTSRDPLPVGKDCDLNNVLQNGIYPCNIFHQMQHSTDIPCYDYGLLEVLFAAGKYIQIFHSDDGSTLIRTLDGGAWSQWHKEISDIDFNNLKSQLHFNNEVGPESGDFNNFTQTGYYTIWNPNNTNAPVRHNGTLLVFNQSNTESLIQAFFVGKTNEIYTRQRGLLGDNTDWQPWKNITGGRFKKSDVNLVGGQTTFNNAGDWDYYITFHAIKGQTYYISCHVDSTSGGTGVFNIASTDANPSRGDGFYYFDPGAENLGGQKQIKAPNDYITHWTATKTGPISIGCGGIYGNCNTSKWCITQSDHYVPFEKAESNKNMLQDVAGVKNLESGMQQRANEVAVNAVNQANAHADDRFNELNNQLAFNIPNLVGNDTTQAVLGWWVDKHIQSKPGKTYWISYDDGGRLIVNNVNDDGQQLINEYNNHHIYKYVAHGDSFTIGWDGTTANGTKATNVCVTQSTYYVPLGFTNTDLIDRESYFIHEFNNRVPNLAPKTSVKNCGWEQGLFWMWFKAGKRYWMSCHVDRAENFALMGSTIDPYGWFGRFSKTQPNAKAGEDYVVSFVPQKDIYANVFGYAASHRDPQSSPDAGGTADLSNICITQSDHYVPYKYAQAYSEPLKIMAGAFADNKYNDTNSKIDNYKASVDKAINPTIIDHDVDANTLQDTGLYYVNGHIIYNTPFGNGTNWAFIRVISSGGMIVQTMFGTDDQWQPAIRLCSGYPKTWQNWNTIANMGDVNNGVTNAVNQANASSDDKLKQAKDYTDNKFQVANDESDAQNKSNQNPNNVYFYTN